MTLQDYLPTTHKIHQHSDSHPDSQTTAKHLFSLNSTMADPSLTTSDRADAVSDSAPTVPNGTPIKSLFYRIVGVSLYLIASAFFISLLSLPAVEIFDMHFFAKAYSYFAGNIYWTLSFAGLSTVVFFGDMSYVFEILAKWASSAAEAIKSFGNYLSNLIKTFTTRIGKFPQLAKDVIKQLCKYTPRFTVTHWNAVLYLMINIFFISLYCVKSLPLQWTCPEQSPEKAFGPIATVIVDDASAPVIFKVMQMVAEMRRI